MEEKIAKWVIEYLLRKRIDDKVINGVISSLPLADNDYRLKKTILLRRIETETTIGCVSEKILELIELIEALDHEQGKTASDLIKEAYCSVAVDCTVRFLGESVEENGKYLEMVEIVWRNRVCKSEGLNSEAVERWLDDIEAAGKDEEVCEKIWRRNTRNEALKAVKKYLVEAWECLGPPFLEVVAIKEGNRVEGVCRNGGGGGGDVVVGSGNSLRESVAVEGSQKGLGLIRRKHVAVKSKRPRGAKISDADEVTERAADRTTETIRAENPIREENLTPAMDRAKEATSSSSTKLPTGGDHLSDNFPTPQTLLSTGPTVNDNVVEANKTRTEIPESGEPVRRKRGLINGRRELHTGVNYPLPEGDKSNDNVVEADNTRTEIPVSGETVRMQRTLRNSAGELHAAVDDPLPEGAKNNNNAVEADKTRTQIPDSRQTLRMQRNLRNSTSVLHSAVNDPLPEALQSAQTLLSSMATINHETLSNNQKSQDTPTIPEAEEAPELAKKTVLSTGNDAGVLEQAGTETNANKGSNENDPRNVKHDILEEDVRGHVTQDPGIQKNTRKRNLMEPNGTSHTYEWDDDIENSSGSPTRPRLPSPKVQRTSPLKIPDHKNLQRRVRKRWTPVEEDALREGVLKYGRGNWKMILANYAEAFQARTDVDLKDKWRNMTKYS